MNKPKLLIVDDDEAIRTQLKYALRDDFTLLFAEDRGGALITLRAEHPELVSLDLGLPPHPDAAEEGLKAFELGMGGDDNREGRASCGGILRPSCPSWSGLQRLHRPSQPRRYRTRPAQSLAQQSPAECRRGPQRKSHRLKGRLPQ